MALKHRDYVLLGIGAFIAWGLAVKWLPILRYLGYALVLGAFLSSAVLFALVLLTIRSPNDAVASSPSPTNPRVAFLARHHWDQETQAFKSRSIYNPHSLYPQSFIVSEGIDELLSFATRDFIASWYQHISPNPTFVNEVDHTIRTAIGNLRDRLLTEDLVSLVVSRIFPVLTSHLKEFEVAERLVRGRNLTRNVTESEELDIAIASKYREGNLHPAAMLSLSDQKLLEQEYLRKIAVGLLPQLFPESVLNSRIVSVLIREIVACAVLFPLVSVLSDPDTWNQLMEAYGRTAIQDRKTVRKLRAALDEHASPAPRSKRGHPFPRLSPHDSERAFERFVRAIRRCNNLSDARRFRALVASQLKRETMVEGQDQVYLRRLETGKRVLDQKVAKLSAPGGTQMSHASAAVSHFRRKNSIPQEASLVDVMHDASGLSYFMEFMDRQQLMSLVQFWIVVDGFRNPLEDDFGDESSPTSTSWTPADRSDMALISETYLSKPELKVSDESRRVVKAFLSAGKRATSEQYRKARTVILSTQSAVLDKLQEIYYPKFKQSDLYYKYLASDEASQAGPQSPQQSSPNIAEVPERRPLPPLMSRTSSQPGARPKDLRRAAVSSSDVRSMGKLFDDDESSRRSFDSERSAPLFDDDYDTDPLAMSTQSLGKDSQNGETEANQNQVIENMEAALNDIIASEPKNTRIEDLKNADVSPSALPASDPFPRSPRSSMDIPRADSRTEDRIKPSIASLGLVDRSSRQGVFDDDLFPEQQKYIEDEYEEPMGTDTDPADQVHEAAPGDLGLTEAIEALTADIDKLGSQESVVDTLTRKAELTNNTAELRILRKSKASIQREIHRKEMQRQQYIIQESDNSLYGRSTVRIKSIVVGKEEDGREFAMYVVEVQRNAGEQMPAASWAVARRYSEFHELHQKLRMRYPSVRHLEFPRRRVVLKLQKEFLQKRRLALEAYLQKLLLLPEVCRSRDLRAFLSQRAIIPRNENQSSTTNGETKDLVTRIYNSVADGMDDFLGNFGVLDQLSTAGQSLISAATNQQSTTSTTVSPGDTGLATEDAVTAAEAEAELNAFEDRELEPFIKPICDLFLEAFELNKGNNWLRGRAVVVVLHQLLGGTIERKVREGARSLVQDDSLLRYITLIKDTMWPGGVLRQSRVRTASERLKSRTEASLVLATLIPDLAGNVVGRANAQAAARRIFATLNNRRLNAHLFFTILDEVVLVLFGAGGRGTNTLMTSC
ncbi:intermediate filament protein [Aspergillus tubingensis]|uniref:Intermediate filament protein n=2 Tax=Aspergillus subgen. Circumdati TaxID=2720871 RepID=A0A124BX55_ASPNG|nr:intermediate filament protein [Aspergillus tubingensis]GAQ41332.1 intermediate filament protein [Aspergillus niger]GFN19275.1 intermediate filament protein [Aspergillus tubingensis]GLA63528.1 intermediate filament protein [Aspergillus tubingensis]GLA76211.1 intermediate filament protein [Aspergillus tubingensis]GLA80192.1 intermediate filament protein [Aspergillus tubingensis]